MVCVQAAWKVRLSVVVCNLGGHGITVKTAGVGLVANADHGDGQ